jgi:hypothetical protein
MESNVWAGFGRGVLGAVAVAVFGEDIAVAYSLDTDIDGAVVVPT